MDARDSTSALPPSGRRGDTLKECRRLLDLANRLTYWRFTGDDRAFIAPGPWRTHETEQT